MTFSILYINDNVMNDEYMLIDLPDAFHYQIAQFLV